MKAEEYRERLERLQRRGKDRSDDDLKAWIERLKAAARNILGEQGESGMRELEARIAAIRAGRAKGDMTVKARFVRLLNGHAPELQSAVDRYLARRQ